MKGHWIRYTNEQLAWIKENCTRSFRRASTGQR